MSDRSNTRVYFPVVLVTGASGYIASHCIKELLEQGYRVRGTVRDIKCPAKVDPIKRLDKHNRLELMELNLNNEMGWDKAVSGCTYILHIASPISLNADESFIRTAVDGTLRALRAAQEEPSVRKIVMTSSALATSEGHNEHRAKYDETMWTDGSNEKIDFYSRSKSLAEKAAWDFVENNRDGNKFALTTMLPVLVTGPTLLAEEKFSDEFIKMLFTMPAVPKLHVPCVDVRDVAHAHVLAMTNTNSDGQRIMLSNEARWMCEMGKTIKDEFGPQGYSPATTQIPNFFISFASLFNNQARMTKQKLGHENYFDNAKSKRILGLTYRPVEDSLISMVYSLIENGSLKKTSKYNGVPKRYHLHE